MLFGKTISAYPDNRNKHTNATCQQNSELLFKVKADGIYSNHFVLKGPTGTEGRHMDCVILITEYQFSSSIQMGDMNTLFCSSPYFRRCLHMPYTKDITSFSLFRLLNCRRLCQVLLQVGVGSLCVFIHPGHAV
jgi:hypothetical protein